jgi:hypothetical protein
VDAAGGFSWSALLGAEAASSDPDYFLYLPFPFYNNRQLVKRLLECDGDLAVGKWRKKALDSTTVAFLILVIKPLWDTLYKELLEKHIIRLITNLKPALPEEVTFNCMVEKVPVRIYKPLPDVLFLPSLSLDSLTKVPDGLEAAKTFCESHFLTTGKQIIHIRMKLDSAGDVFMVLHVRYSDGTHKDYA